MNELYNEYLNHFAYSTPIISYVLTSLILQMQQQYGYKTLVSVVRRRVKKPLSYDQPEYALKYSFFAYLGWIVY